MKPNLTPEQAANVLKKDDLNTIEQAAAGRTLSDAQRSRLERVAREAPVTVPKQIQTDTERAGKLERAYKTEKRRNRVFDLRVADFSIREIASKLGVNVSTILSDLKALDKKLMETIDLTQTQKHVNNMLKVYERIVTRSQREIEKGLSGTELAQAMSSMQKALDSMMKLKQDAGIMPRAIDKMEVSGPDSQPLAMGKVIFMLPDNGRGPRPPEE